MKIEEKIITESYKLFDVAGIAPDSDSSHLILGMATSPEQDLDDFQRDRAGLFKMRGYEKYVQSKLDSLIHLLDELGLSAKIVGRCGYPEGDVLNLKQQAVVAGLGMWGRNSMMLHPRLGLSLRLMAVRIVDIILSSTDTGTDSQTENPLCNDCTACIDACPLGIVGFYYLRESSSCLANVSKLSQPGKIECCDLCWKACPVGHDR